MIYNQIELDGHKDLIKKGLSPVMLVIRDTKGKSIYELNDEKLISGKLMLECHYFIKKDGSVVKVRDEDMETELDKPLYNKYMIVIDIEGDFNIETMDHTRGNSLIELALDIKSRYQHLDKIVPYYDLYPESKTPGTNFPIAYVNELFNDNDTYFVKVDKHTVSRNPYLNKITTVYKSRKLFLNSPKLSGTDVSTLKYKLAEIGFNVDVDNDIYDESTADAINSLRQKLGLPQNGIATIDLMEEIDLLVNSKNSHKTSSKPIQFTRVIELATPYMEGTDIRQIKMILKANDFYDGEIDDVYDVFTANAVKKFQHHEDLVEDGIITPNVWKLLSKMKMAKFTRLIYLTNPQMTGSDILAIQNRLLALGYNSIELSGSYDIQTEEIVKQFQRNNSLKSDGKITQTVFNLIFK